ncbi:hypothetical protein BH09ACT3_BH09ACT3_10620 [soil metagenome]
MDYGHVIEFGTFVTPTNSPPQAPVALAQLSERLGFDLVTFQDHPYQPGFLDSWTLISWVAAQTERIHVAANVHSLPMRPPAVLARSVASLDLLSGGRIELGLGAGGFWDAIEAMGGPRRTPGEGVDALSEAIEVIRGIWDADERSPLRIHGEHYRIDGAKRGPAPAHDVPIWLGAYKPRMLRLTGSKADAWLPSLPYMKPGDLQKGNAAIDDAAAEAGRDPREIRRLLNVGGRFSPRGSGMLDGPPEQWVEQLLHLAIEDGIGSFIVMGDDPRSLQIFADDVAPDLRERIAAERASSGTVSGAVRSAAALALRREGIEYDDLPTSLAARAIEPGDFGYRNVKSTYLRGGSPGLVLRPRDTAEVVDAVAFARRHRELPLGVRSGGHGISGRSTNDGGLVIDLGAMNAIEVIDKATRRVRIQPGARWADVAAALEPHGWALSSGDYGGVGVGGLATAGGIGWLSRHHGLTIDHLRAVEIVLADGTVSRASIEQNPELFWAVRGAGANFGIVTSFEFEVDEVAQVGWAQLVFEASDTAAFIEGWASVVEAAPRELTSFMILGGRRSGQPMYAQVMAVVDSADADTIVSMLQPLAEVAPLVQQSVELTSYAAIMANVQPGPQHGQGEPHSRSALVDHVTPEIAAMGAELVNSGASYFFQIRSIGGATADVAPDATAFAHRSANFSIAAFGVDERIDEAWDRMDVYFDGLYLSFETDLSADRIGRAFPPETLARLRVLKAELDPQNLFRDNFTVAQ